MDKFKANDVEFHNSGKKFDLCTACVLYGIYKRGNKYIKLVIRDPQLQVYGG
jgi:hypothetical protein